MRTSRRGASRAAADPADIEAAAYGAAYGEEEHRRPERGGGGSGGLGLGRQLKGLLASLLAAHSAIALNLGQAFEGHFGFSVEIDGFQVVVREEVHQDFAFVRHFDLIFGTQQGKPVGRLPVAIRMLDLDVSLDQRNDGHRVVFGQLHFVLGDRGSCH